MLRRCTGCTVVLVSTLTCTSEPPAGDTSASTGTNPATTVGASSSTAGGATSDTTTSTATSNADSTDSSSSTGEMMPWPPSATFTNPVLWDDLADIEVLRVDDVFYYTASTMHYSPGAPILRSYDLVQWEYAGHAVPRLDFGDHYDLDGRHAYVSGIWASTLNYRASNETFYWLGCIQFAQTQDVSGGTIWLRATVDISPGPDRQGTFSYSTDGTTFTELGSPLTLNNNWTFFMGYRFAMFNYATQSLGGAVTIASFALG